jgi:putative two-component system response regulator
MLALARNIALTHHEKWDGSGYPKGLKGEDIPLEGRITAIADVFDALTSVRPYKKAWSEEEALDFLVQQKGKHFDPALVDLFIAQMPAIRAIRLRWAEGAQELKAA